MREAWKKRTAPAVLAWGGREHAKGLGVFTNLFFQPASCINRHREESSAVPIETRLLPIAAFDEITETNLGTRPGTTSSIGAPEAPKSTLQEVTKVVCRFASTWQLRSRLGCVAWL